MYKQEKIFQVRFYADSYKYGPNYLFIYDCANEAEAQRLINKFNAKAAWFGVKGLKETQKRIK